VLLRPVSRCHMAPGIANVQSIALGDKLNLLNQRQGSGGGDIETTSISGQGRDCVHSLVPEVLQPLPTDVCVEQNSSYGGAQQSQQDTTLAQTRTTEPVKQEYEDEGNTSCGSDTRNVQRGIRGQICVGEGSSIDLSGV